MEIAGSEANIQAWKLGVSGRLSTISRKAALSAGVRHGFRFLSERRVVLEDGDPERVMVIFQRCS